MRISFPWPDKELFPNARAHWAGKARRVRISRCAAFLKSHLAVKTQYETDWLASDEIIPYGLIIQPKDRRRRDEDNIIAALKSTLDGIAEGLGVNDSRFRLTWIQWVEPAKPASITIALLEPPPKQLAEVFDDRNRANPST